MSTKRTNENRPAVNRCRSRLGRSIALLSIVAIGAFTAGRVVADKQPATPKIDAAAMARMVQSFEKVEKLEEDWGWLRWMMNSKLDPGTEMTFGLVQVNAGHRNPMHIHPNCEEHLYMLSGSCEHVLGDQVCTLEAGDMIRIPRGVPHYAKTKGDEPMKAVIAYSSGDRQFVVVDEPAAK